MKFTPIKPNLYTFKSVLLFLSIGILFLLSSCNSASSEVKNFDKNENSIKKVRVSNELTSAEIAQEEMLKSISNLFDKNYSLQTKGRRLLMAKYLNHEDFAGELAKKGIIFLNKEDDKFDQYNVVLLLSKASPQSIHKEREVIRKYLMRIERKEYVGPKMNKYISLIKKNLN